MSNIRLQRFFAAAVATSVLSVAPAQDSPRLVNSIVKAPVTPNGDVAGAPTDFVINLNTSLDPSVPGRTLAAGRTVKVILPDSFQAAQDLPFLQVFGPNCTVPLEVPQITCNTAVFLQGWPQHPVAPASYALSLEGSSTVVFTAKTDITAAPPLDPGIKQIHLLLLGFKNPDPGDYPIEVQAQTGPGGSVESGVAYLHIRSAPRPSINVTSNLFAPAGLNAVYQTTSVNKETARPFDFLLWDRNGQPIEGVTISSPDSGEDSTGLILKGNDVIGLVYVEAPPGATDWRISPMSPSSRVGSPVTGLPAASLRAAFLAGSVPGDYTVTFTLAGGNSATMFVSAK